MDEVFGPSSLPLSSPLKPQVAEAESSFLGIRPFSPVAPAGSSLNSSVLPECEAQPVKATSAHNSLMPQARREDAAEILVELHHQPSLLDNYLPMASSRSLVHAALEFSSLPLSQLFAIKKKKTGQQRNRWGPGPTSTLFA